MLRSTLPVIGLAAALVLPACGPSRKVSFNITQPATITFPAEANTILLIDRTKFADGWLNTLEGLLTGELPTDDRHAAQACLASLKSRLDDSPRYNVRILTNRFDGNSLSHAFPPVLGWDFISGLCRDNQSDIVVALEVFDSNFIVTNGSSIKKRTEGSGDNKREVEYTEYWAQGVGSVKLGIRTYSLRDSSIVDEQFLDRQNTWTATGVSPLDALALLISKSNSRSVKA